MVIVCPGCKNQITLDDATIPVGTFKVRCTGCGRSITAQKKEEPVQQQQQQPAASIPKQSAITTDKIKPQTISTDTSRIPPDFQNFVNSQIALAKQEILNAIQTLFSSGGSARFQGSDEKRIASNTALICSGDPSTLKTIVGLLEPMGYQIQPVTTAAESIQSVDATHELIVIDPSFTDDLEGSKKIIGRLNAKKGTDRRKVFVVLLSTTQKSLDGNSAFLSGVNLIVNKADLNNLESFVRQGQNHFQKLYSPFENYVESK